MTLHWWWNQPWYEPECVSGDLLIVAAAIFQSFGTNTGSFFRLVLLVHCRTVLCWGWSGLWSLAKRWSRKKQNDTRFIKAFLELHLSYRNLLKYQSGMMSASGPLNSLWKRHTGNSSFKTGGNQSSEFSNGRQQDYIAAMA